MTDPRDLEFIGVPPADLLEEVVAAWREAGLNPDECLQRSTTVTKEFVYTPGAGSLRRCFSPKYNRDHTLPVKHRDCGWYELIHKQRHICVFVALLLGFFCVLL